MFKESISENKIPPNFLNSILTNNSLYEMFKNDFESNIEYFQNISKEEYLKEMLKFIEDTLFSTNIFHIYSSSENIDELTKDKLSYIKLFYDDFLLKEFESEPENILKTRLFRGLEYAKKNDIYASKTKEFISLYDYIFIESIDYYGIKDVLLKESLEHLKKKEALTFQEFDILCNWVKNNTEGIVDFEIALSMLYNHAYKINHIFDALTAQEIVKSIILSYLDLYNVTCDIEFSNGIDGGTLSAHNLLENKIELDFSLIEGFISLNYVELFEIAFYEARILKNATLLKRNNCDYDTLRLIMELITNKVDLEKIYVDDNYKNNDYYLDFKASNFVSTLRFFSHAGINLFTNYVNSKIKDLDIENIIEKDFSKKEISLDQRFENAFSKIANKNDIIKKFPVLHLIYTSNGTRKKTIDIIKSLKNIENRDVLISYLHTRIIEPERIIEDVIDLANYRAKDQFIKNFITDELKYIYGDTFYYSLNSYTKLNNSHIDLEEYLSGLLVKINCIKETPLTHRFKDMAIITIKDIQQNS